ncbi:hypothetical protein G9A89_018145 [Geosiphon pyriformis]|nr:hypothetical protein G9A89_018145 [Geosiphon pyriformis]
MHLYSELVLILGSLVQATLILSLPKNQNYIDFPNNQQSLISDKDDFSNNNFGFYVEQSKDVIPDETQTDLISSSEDNNDLANFGSNTLLVENNFIESPLFDVEPENLYSQKPPIWDQNPKNFFIHTNNLNSDKLIENLITTKKEKEEKLNTFSQTKQFKPKQEGQKYIIRPDQEDDFELFARLANGPYCGSDEQIIGFGPHISAYLVKDRYYKRILISLKGNGQEVDVLTDPEKFKLISYPIANVSNSTHVVKTSPKPHVHRTFYTRFQSQQKKILASVEKYMKLDHIASIHMVGHAFGGAYAVLTALFLKQRYPKRLVFVWTFGQPRLGDPTFAQYINQLDRLVIRRITVSDDSFPHFPRREDGFLHHEEEIYEDFHLGRKYVCEGTPGAESPDCANKEEMTLGKEKVVEHHFGPYFGTLMNYCQDFYV